MSTYPPRFSTVIAMVSRAGEIRERHRGEITVHAGLSRYLRTAARIGLPAPVCFAWDTGPDPVVLPKEPDTGHPQILRVHIAPAGRPSGGCHVEVRLFAPEERSGLTGRELQVLTLVACGLTNPDIATRLTVSRRTAATHVERLLHKLGVTSRAAATAIALDRDLFTLPVRGELAGLPSLGPLRLEAAVRDNPGSPSTPDAPRRRVTRPRPLLIGAVYPSAGDWLGDGLKMEQGTRLAVDEINERGGVAGRRIEHIPLRVNIQDGRAIQHAIERLVGEDVDAITTGYTLQRSRDSLSAQFLPAASAGSPLLHHSTSASAADLIAEETDTFSNVFQVCGRESVYGTGFVRMLTTLRDSGAWRPASNRLQVFDADDTDMTTFTPSAMEAAERAGWRPAVEHINSFAPDWTTVISQIRDLDPAAVMIAHFATAQMAAFVREFRRDPSDALLYALYSPSVPQFLDQADGRAEGMLWATVSGLYGDNFGHQFERRFLRRFGSTPGLSSAGIRYDMIHLLAAAWSQCDSPHDTEEVNRVLRRIVHRGVNGSYHFGSPDQTNLVYPDQTTDPSIAQAHLVYQVQDGHHHIIAPTPYSTAPFRPVA
ncbi:ABC transporter substrate-binding protein [Kitasatospora sp. NPDC088548]|uniref:ABC transporter substrate-binding protein n=1 Tax=Kitasatospora sp. NPDC088548 TaxID=3364075 RepID=UPI00380A0BEE